jgi:hypothetical protein
MPRSTARSRQALSAAVLSVGGGGLAVATWISGSHGLAVGVLGAYLVGGVIAFFWAGGNGDVAAVLRANGDERQRTLDRDATALSAIAMSVAAIAGSIVAVARSGAPGDFGVICVVGGVSYTAALITLRLRR